ncbi:hypothetical protein EJ08DRAFT_582410 [Tothia fuscella]|uniref:Dynamin family protein n=1 Tax=Tothia fuscella TaxID=1048955 RepID=A0A9P4NYX8_9PEZI|nr:hypothetical protein EJ08DRAFT_582410 [Tothia fuscella]
MPVRSTPASSALTVQDGLEIMGSTVKKLVHEIKELDHHGISYEVPLPKIVVVGDQSAGKSSLIEAISEIKVPRDTSTCTRCPLQINLVDGGEKWSCVVSLLKNYDFDRNPDTNTPRSPLHPWYLKAASTKVHLTQVERKEDLERVIRQAQYLTLNPDINPSLSAAQFAHLPTTGRMQEFSPNVVCLEITAPGLPNLSFHDLPGVFNQSAKGGKETVELVDRLVCEYIRQENTLILLAVPMESDAENSKASGLLNEIEGANARCIGVLTKPDCLQSADNGDAWRRVLEGVDFPQGHGYFAVKQPDRAALIGGITHDQARILEEQFFASASWTNRFPGFQDRLGTRNLQQALATKLAALIIGCLPRIIQQVQVAVNNIDEELRDLPDPPANALQVVTNILAHFDQTFRQRIDGEKQPNDLSTAWKDIKKTFKQDIISVQRPTLLVNTVGAPQELSRPVKNEYPTNPKSSPLKKPKTHTEVINLDSDTEQEAPVTPSPAKKRKFTLEYAPSSNALKTVFRLDEIRRTLDEFCSSGLPDIVEPKAVDNLILSTLENWHVPTSRLVNALENVLRSALQRTLEETAREWKTTLLFSEIMRISQQVFLRVHVGHLRDMSAPRALRLERTKPITEDTKTMSRYIQEETEHFQNARFKALSETYFDKLDTMTGKETSPHDRERKRQSDREGLKAKIGPDPYDREVRVMAQIRGYYQIASMRFVDNIRQMVEAELFAKFRDGLHNDLQDGLKVHGADCHDYCAKLLDDDPVRTQRRQELKQRKASLEDASCRLKALLDGSRYDTPQSSLEL